MKGEGIKIPNIMRNITYGRIFTTDKLKLSPYPKRKWGGFRLFAQKQAERKNTCSTLFYLKTKTDKADSCFFWNPRRLFRQSRAYFSNVVVFGWTPAVFPTSIFFVQISEMWNTVFLLLSFSLSNAEAFACSHKNTCFSRTRFSAFITEQHNYHGAYYNGGRTIESVTSFSEAPILKFGNLFGYFVIWIHLKKNEETTGVTNASVLSESTKIRCQHAPCLSGRRLRRLPCIMRFRFCGWRFKTSTLRTPRQRLTTKR